MDSFGWSDTFLTGIDLVDEQHHQLVDVINRFGEGVAGNHLGPDESRELLRELAKYTHDHFRDEEAIMRDVGIDRRHLDLQLRAHHEFIAEVETMTTEADLSSPAVGKELLDFLIHWLAYHILGADQNMASQVAYIEQGLDPAEAYAREEHERAASTEPLVAALNGLFDQVTEQNRKLQELNEDLEGIVEERTRELVRANAALEVLSMTDALTGLPNRRQAMAMLDAVWHSASDLACIMIDADHFKEVNDTYGHDKGDLVLRELAKTLSHSFRNDDVVCRLGGDEFFIICPETDLAGGVRVAEATRRTVAELRVPTGGDPWVGSISMGVAGRTPNMGESADLVKQADEALYAAKDAGKNCVRPIL